MASTRLRRKLARLSLIIHNLSPVDLPSYFDITNRTTCQCHPLRIIVPYAQPHLHIKAAFSQEPLKIGISYQYT